MLFPRKVDELGVRAHGNELGTQLREAILLLCQSSEFGRSDEGEVRWVEEQNSPFTLRLDLIEADGPEVVFDRVIGRKLEIGNRGAKLQPAPIG